MKYIETLHEGDRVGDIYLCKFRQAAVTKNGKNYENVILQDKTGTLDAKIWEPNSQGIDDFDVLDYVYIVGDVTSFQGALQLRDVYKRQSQYVSTAFKDATKEMINSYSKKAYPWDNACIESFHACLLYTSMQHLLNIFYTLSASYN